MKISNSIILALLLWLTTITHPITYQSYGQISRQRIGDKTIIYKFMNLNVAAIESKNGMIIIDTHRSLSTMRTIKQLIEKDFGRKDFLYVINTHGDYDHTSGNQIIDGATIIGHENCPEFMKQNPANSRQMIWSLKARIDGMKKNYQDRNEPQEKIEIWDQMLKSTEYEYKVTPPTMTFRDSMTLVLDDLTIKMSYCGNAHTDNDIFIYIPEENLVFTGDLFTSKNSFGFYINKMNDIQRVVSSMNQIIRHPSEIKYVIPGHGDILSRIDFIHLRDLLIERSGEIPPTKSAVQLLESVMKTSGISAALKNNSEIELMQSEKYYYQENEFSILSSRLLRKGMIDEAIEVLKLYIKVFPNSALGFDYLGEAYLKKGKNDSAIANYSKSLEIFPENKNAIEMLKMLGHIY